jgi:hypothetical protein
MSTLRNALSGAYAWLAAAFFGSVLLDVVYTSLLRDAGGPGPSLQVVFGEVSDFLLILGSPTLLAALAAIALSWSTPPARNLFLASLVALSLEFIGPMVLFPLVGNPSNSPLPGISAYARLIPLALASILALAGFRNLCRERVTGAPTILDPLDQSRGA